MLGAKVLNKGRYVWYQLLRNGISDLKYHYLLMHWPIRSNISPYMAISPMPLHFPIPWFKTLGLGHLHGFIQPFIKFNYNGKRAQDEPQFNKMISNCRTFLFIFGQTLRKRQVFHQIFWKKVLGYPSHLLKELMKYITH